MNKIFLIIKREYLTRVRKRVFVATTFLAPLGLAAVTFLPAYLINHSMEEEKIALYDESGIFSGKLENTPSIIFGHINPKNVPYDSLKAHYTEHFKGILRIPANFDINAPGDVEFYSADQLGMITQSDIADQMNEVLRKMRLEQANIPPEVMEKLNTPVHIIQPELTLGNAETSTLLGYAMGFMIYIVLLIYGTMVMRGVMEEKNNRIAEVITSSVKPFQLMMGKIIGIAFVGLTQFIIWIVLSGVIMTLLKGVYAGDISQAQNFNMMNGMQGTPQQQAPEIANFLVNMDKLPLGLIAFGFIFFFLGGYLLYASIFAALGAASGEESDQSLTFIATIPIIISTILLITVLNQPNSKLAIIGSLIPFSAPIIMAGRLPFVPPAWQIILSALLLVAGFVFTVWVAGKIYRTGILMYGKKVTLREMLKWVRY